MLTADKIVAFLAIKQEDTMRLVYMYRMQQLEMHKCRTGTVK